MSMSMGLAVKAAAPLVHSPAEEPPSCAPRSTPHEAVDVMLEEAFDRHFATRQFRSDLFGTCIGSLIYLSLTRPLAEAHRPDLAAAALFCAGVCLWPAALARWAPRFYAARRDFILLLHFLFHYCLGGQLGRIVRLNAKWQAASPAAFLASYILSSTLLWQGLDAMMYRMRFHRFVLLKPLVMLCVLPLERRLCEQTCADMPGQAHHFSEAAELLRLLLAAFRPLPQPLGVAAPSIQGAVLSCIKVQSFLMALFTWLLPAVVLRRLERQMFSRYAAEHWQRLSSEAAAGAQEGSVAGGPPPSDAGASTSSSPRASPSASRTSSGSLGASDASGGGPGLWRRAAELSRGWRLQHAREQVAAQRQGGAAQAPPPELGHSRFDSWGVSLLLAGLCWHAIDTLL